MMSSNQEAQQDQTSFSPDTTIALNCYNSARYVGRCLESVLSATPAGTPIVVVDNGSSDGTPAIVRSQFPSCRLIELQENIGHSAACNVALQAAETTWVLLLDHDTAVPQGWLQPLLDAARSCWPHTGMVSSRAIFPEQDRIHHDGGYAHFVAHMTLRNGGQPIAAHPATSGQILEVGAQAATSLLIHRRRALEVGGFDEPFFIYLNDFELSLRMRLRGWRCYVVPQSVVYHYQGNPETSWRGSGSYPARRAYLIYRNRWLLIAKIYSLRTLLLCGPALLVYEVTLLAAAVRKRWLGAYLRALRDAARMLPAMLRERAAVQQSRAMSDRELLAATSFSYVPGLIKSPFARAAKHALEGFFRVYWKLISPLLSM